MGTSTRDQDVESTAIELPSGIGRLATTIKSSSLSLLMGSGTTKTDGTPILVPFMVCEFNAIRGGEEEERTVSATLTLDNVAFLLMQLGEEYLDALDAFEAMAAGGMHPQRHRLEYARQWLVEGAAALTKASARLHSIGERTGPSDATARKATSRTKPESASRAVVTRKKGARLSREPTFKILKKKL